MTARAGREVQPSCPHDEETEGEPAGDMVAEDHGRDATECERERSAHPGSCGIDRDEEEIHDGHGEGEGDRLVGVLGVEAVELRTGGVGEHADAARTRRVAGTLDDEEDSQNEHDPDGGEHDQLVEHQRETGEPSGRGSGQLEPGIVGAYRQDRIGGKQGVAVEQVGEGSKVGQLVEAVQEERLEHRVRGEEPETEDE